MTETEKKWIIHEPGEMAHNLEFDGLSFEFNRPDLEVDTNSRDIAFCVCIICKTQKKTRLSNARVSCEYRSV